MPKISVIMPVYNTKGEYLKEAIESILNQTFQDFEFLIIDDGSDRETAYILQQYANYDTRIRIINKGHNGLSKALNIGIENAKGEYIARMDSDDISLPDRFAEQIKYFDRHSEISVLGTWIETFPRTKIIKHPANPKYIDFLCGCVIAHPSVMFRKKDLGKYNLNYSLDYACEDYELWSRAIKYLNFANLQHVLLRYRMHNENLSTHSKVPEDTLKVQCNMLDFLTNDINVKRKLNNIVQNKRTKLIEKIFSVKNSVDKKYKNLIILGITFKFKRHKS